MDTQDNDMSEQRSEETERECVYCGYEEQVHPTVVTNGGMDIDAEECYGVYRRD